MKESTTMRTPTHASLRRLAAGGLTSIAIVLSACGGAATASPSPSATAAAKATLAPVTAATTAPTAAAAAVVNVEAYQAGDSFLLKADQIAVPAGKVTFNFKNTGTMTHEVLVYPVQDVTKLLALKRSGNDAEEKDYIKGLAVGLMDIESGKTATADATLAPGFYELACWAVGKNPDGTTYEHFDKGQTLTLVVTGPGGPAASVGIASNTVAVEMKGEEAGSWLLVPDRLVLSAGEEEDRIGLAAEEQGPGDVMADAADACGMIGREEVGFVSRRGDRLAGANRLEYNRDAVDLERRHGEAPAHRARGAAPVDRRLDLQFVTIERHQGRPVSIDGSHGALDQFFDQRPEVGLARQRLGHVEARPQRRRGALLAPEGANENHHLAGQQCDRRQKGKHMVDVPCGCVALAEKGKQD